MQAGLLTISPTISALYPVVVSYFFFLWFLILITTYNGSYYPLSKKPLYSKQTILFLEMGGSFTDLKFSD